SSLHLTHSIPSSSVLTPSCVRLDLPPFPTRRSSDLLKGHCTVTMGIAAKANRHRGIGTCALIMGLRYAFYSLGLQKVTTDTLSTDRKSTRLNSSHVKISYAVFCLKKKKTSIQDNSRY